MINTEQIAKDIYLKVKKQQVEEFQKRMPQNKKGVEFTIGNKTYIAAIRRLTPIECKKLQTVPDDYEFVTSETQQYACLGNGWTIDVISYIFSFIPEYKRKNMIVLSLFDGMSGGQIALKKLNANVTYYLASEINKYAIANTMHNFPNTIQLGNVKDIDIDKLINEYGIPTMLIGGSPCTDMSFSGKMRGMVTSTKEEVYTLERYLQLKNQGFQFEGQSYLFWEYMRILTELRRYNPNIYFFLENVRMLEKWERCISRTIGVRGVHINSALISAQNRRRIYWTNIRTKKIPQTSLFPNETDDDFSWPSVVSDIPQPKDKNLVLKDVLQDNVDEKYYLKSESVEKLLDKTDKNKLKEYLFEPQVSVKELIEFMDRTDDLKSLTDKEKLKIAELAYKIEEQSIKENYDKEKSCI